MKMAKDLDIQNFHVGMRDEINALKPQNSFNTVVTLHTSEKLEYIGVVLHPRTFSISMDYNQQKKL